MLNYKFLRVARRKTKNTKDFDFALFLIDYKDKISGLLLLFFAVLTLIADSESVFWKYYFSFLEGLFGIYYIWILPPASFLLWILLLKKSSEVEFNSVRAIGLFLYFTALTTIFSWFIDSGSSGAFDISLLLTNLLGQNAMYFMTAVILIISIVTTFRFSFIDFFHTVKEKAVELKSDSGFEFEEEVTPKGRKKLKPREESPLESEKRELQEMLEKIKREKESLEKAKASRQMTFDDPDALPNTPADKTGLFGWVFAWGSDKKKVPVEVKKPEKEKMPVIKKTAWSKKAWEFPSIDLLKRRISEVKISEYDIRSKQLEIQEKLAQFRIKVEMLDSKVWPTVVQYRLEPSHWVKLNRIENLKKDLTLALKAKSIRIQAPIPWEWVVWIEVPNDKREMVGLRDVVESAEFKNPKHKLPFSLGKDVSWNFVVWDLTKMPHMLVAGQTASWKSVGMNWFLISLLYKHSPSDLKFIMIDPKMVELSVYNWIPHLLTPVITSPDKASNALKWCVAEMLRRYDLQKEAVARNVEEYNDKVDKEKKLPYIVIVIDELADLMMSWNKKEVETSIARIAQMARAVWMHLIVATQRPSVDVITGLIKANIPSRIAFTVASQIDSRTVIDKAWAEDLLGLWDMLYYPTWASGPERIQWVYVDTWEVESIVNKIKMTIDPDAENNTSDPWIVNWKSAYEWSVMEWMEGEYDEDPELIEKAIEVVRTAKKGSTSLIQRKLGLGYARAAKVLDILEELWVVWPPNGSKPRDVYE